MTAELDPHAGSRVAERLRELRGQGRAALVAYLPVGYPSVERSIEAARVLTENGVDIVELGLPYSDPVMDGSIIQQAAAASLAGGTRIADTFTAVAEISKLVPTVVMTYFNPVLRYGVEAFAADLAAAGGSGLITPDLVPDEAGQWLEASAKHGLDRIFLVAPSSPAERLAYVSNHTRGFVYAASTMGVTGERASVGSAAEQLVADTRAAGADLVCVGLGVSKREHAAAVGNYADGVIVGSAFVRPLVEGVNVGDWEGALRNLAHTAQELAAGVAEARS